MTDLFVSDDECFDDCTDNDYFTQMMFDSRMYLSNQHWNPNAPFVMSRETIEALINKQNAIDEERYKAVDPHLYNMIANWFASGLANKRSNGLQNALYSFKRKHNILASEIAMVELSDCAEYDDKKQMYNFVNVVKIGVSGPYQRLGLASALIDALKHLANQYNYKRLQIECVVSHNLQSLLNKRNDTFRIHGSNFVINL